MSRRIARALVVVACAFAALPAAAGAATHVSASMAAQTQKPKPCEASFFCFSGTVDPYGAATLDYTPLEAVPHDGGKNCIDVVGVMTVTLDTGTLALRTTSVACFQFAVQGNNGNSISYGNPVTDAGTWTVDGASSTGAFAGATGSGTYVLAAAGARATIRLDGSVSTT